MAKKQDEVVMKEIENMSDEELQKSMELFDSLAEEEIPDLREFDDRMHKMIDDMFVEKHKKKKRKRIYKVAIAAAAGLVLIAGIATFTGRTDALFARMMELVLNDKGTYTEIIANKDNQHVEAFEGCYYPHYVPEGFEIVVNDNMGNVGTLIYHRITEAGTEEIIFSFSDLDSTQIIDTENCDKRNIIINDRQGVLYSKKDESYYMIVFQNEEYMFIVHGNTSPDVLKDVAKNIKK